MGDIHDYCGFNIHEFHYIIVAHTFFAPGETWVSQGKNYVMAIKPGFLWLMQKINP